MHLRGSGTFRPISPVVFVPLGQGIGECERLERAVRSGPLARDVKFPYHPHVTVAHEVADPLLDKAFDELATYDARFLVWGFSMFEKGGDGVWRPQRDFPLGAPLPGPVLPPADVGRPGP
jgi:2'-5' RNA ligase